MSATGRNQAEHARRLHDHYATPSWCVTELLRALPGWAPTLDPCAGDGAIVAACRSTGIETRGVERVETLAAASPAHVSVGDGLDVDWTGEHVIANPPYKTAMRWARKAAAEASSACLLLRLGFLASQERAAFWRAFPPALVAVLSKRPSFAFGGTDAADYAWFGWGRLPGCTTGSASLIWLPRWVGC